MDPRPPRPRPDDELRIAGVAAVRAALDARPDDVRRFFLLEERLDLFRDVLGELARRRAVYRIVPRDELDRIAGGPHHEGVCLVTAPLPVRTLDELASLEGPQLVLGAPGLENPHNLGAILRVAAHFGVTALVLEEADPRLSPAACRTAEGGAEQVPVVRVTQMGRAIATLRSAGFTVLGTSSHGDDVVDLHRAPIARRTFWLVGSESRGLPDALLDACDRVVCIPGSGAVESLNVATATAVLLAESRRPR